ncbi:hypothetical protein BT69DRAFT_1288660, partial [Atractiella rhizophila]
MRGIERLEDKNPENMNNARLSLLFAMIVSALAVTVPNTMQERQILPGCKPPCEGVGVSVFVLM